MPGHGHELDATRKAGAAVRFLSVPVGYEPGPSGRVHKVRVARCRLGECGADGRPKVSVVEDDTYELEAQIVAVAIGQTRPGEALGEDTGVKLTMDGYVAVTEESGRTAIPKIFAAGDCVTGGQELVHAVAGGRRAGEAIDAFLGGRG
jgi:glutamate synthase (NADPH/NADH) small chain